MVSLLLARSMWGKNIGSKTPSSQFYSLILIKLNYSIHYIRGLLLNLKIEWIISFLINNNINYLSMRTQGI